MRIFFLYLLTLFALSASNLARAQDVAAEIDKTQGTIEDVFQYTLTVTGSPDRDPVVPEIDGIQSQGVGKSSSFSVINGSMSRETIYTFILTPLRAGQFVVPAVAVELGGKKPQTLPIRFEVLQTGSSSSQGGPEANESRGALFIEREVEPKEVYLGEPIKSRVKILHKVKIHEADSTQASQSSFLRYQAEEQRSYTKVIGDETYRVIELDEVFIPLVTGEVELPQFSLRAKILVSHSQRPSRNGSLFDQFFGQSPFGGGGQVVEKTLRSDPLKVVVKALPKGAPKDFSGLVGRYQLEASLSHQKISVGETTTLTLVLRGTGGGDLGETPRLTLPPTLKIYSDKPNLIKTVDSAGDLKSVNTYKFAIVPSAPGTFNLGDLRIPVFVPSMAQFVELSASLGTLEVEGTALSSEDESLAQAQSKQKDVTSLKLDLLETRRSKELFQRGLFGFFDYLFAGGLLATCLIFMFVCLSFAYFGERQEDFQKSRRMRRSLSRLKSDLSSIDLLQPELGSLLLHHWRQYLEDYFGFDLKTKTSLEVLDMIFRKKKLDQLLQSEIKLLEQVFARSSYGSSPIDGKVMSKEIQRIAERISAK